MKYLIFAYDTYYPASGPYDFVSAFDTLEEAMAAKLEPSDRACIVTFDDNLMNVIYTRKGWYNHQFGGSQWIWEDWKEA